MLTEHLALINKYPKKTCFVLKGDEIIFSSEAKGVKPLKEFYEERGASEEPLTVVDRIMGKGAVMLAVLIGAKTIVTPIISQIALEYANANGVKTQFTKVVPYIVNRTCDGRCPIETAVLNIDEVLQGYEVMDEKLKSLSK